MRISSLMHVFLSFSHDNEKNSKSTLPPLSGTPPRRGIVEFIPPLRGDSGGCAFIFFCLFFFNNFGIFRIDLHATLWHQMKMEMRGSILSVFYLVNLFILRRRLKSWCSFQDRPPCHVVAPDENENFEGLSFQF